MPGALEGVRVVELAGGAAAAFGARVLGDLGADVRVLEHEDAAPRGTDRRARLLDRYLHWGKSRATAPATRADRERAVTDALDAADILLVGDDLAAIERWGVDPTGLHRARPGLTIVTVTPFGLTGPMARVRASELVLQALGGLLAFSGSSAREPLMRGLRQSTYATGLNAAYTALASHYAAIGSGRAALVDLAQREVIASELVLNEPTYAFIGAVQGRLPESKDLFFTGAPVRASDGYVTLQINNRTGVDSFADILEEERLRDGRFSTAAGRLTHAEELTGLVEAALDRWTSRALFESAADAGLLAGFVQTPEQLLECPQLADRDVWTTVEVDGDAYRLPARLVGLSRTPTAAPAERPLAVPAAGARP